MFPSELHIQVFLPSSSCLCLLKQLLFWDSYFTTTITIAIFWSSQEHSWTALVQIISGSLDAARTNDDVNQKSVQKATYSGPPPVYPTWVCRTRKRLKYVTSAKVNRTKTRSLWLGATRSISWTLKDWLLGCNEADFLAATRALTTLLVTATSRISVVNNYLKFESTFQLNRTVLFLNTFLVIPYQMKKIRVFIIYHLTFVLFA